MARRSESSTTQFADFDHMEPARAEITAKMVSGLSENRKDILSYYSFIADIDRLVDEKEKNKTYLLDCLEALHNGWNGNKDTNLEISENEQQLYSLGRETKRNFCTDCEEWKYIFEDFRSQIIYNYVDVLRRGEILTGNQIDRLRKWTCEPFFRGIIHILIPGITRRDAETISESYASITKHADDINDFEQDIELGLINFPEDVLRKANGIELQDGAIKRVDFETLSLNTIYISEKITELEESFQTAESILSNMKSKYPSCQHRLNLFHDFAYSWFGELKKSYEAIE